MDRFKVKSLVAALAVTGAHAVPAGTDLFFNPLIQSTAVATPNHSNELSSPWQAPAGIVQTNLTSLREVEADPNQSIVRVPGLGSGASMFDMVAFDRSGRFLFIPHETQYGAGVTRYSIDDDRAVVLFNGDLNGGSGDWSGDYGALDPATWTPNDTLLVAEEWSGEGRVFEVMNPMADPSEIVLRELDSIPNVAHEGLRFSRDGGTLYFVDEWNSGSLYKFVPTVQGDYSRGQSFVLVVDGYAGDPSRNWNDPSNAGTTRTGAATWVALTDADGNALTTTDPFLNGPSVDPGVFGARGGRGAADELNATPYGRPEDLEVGRLANGHEVVYFPATSERVLYSVEELGNRRARVRVMASEAATPKNLGQAPTSAVMNSPDNLAQDALGNIYIVEDAPNSSSVGGDVWFVRDSDGDGVAESLDHFLSLQVNGAEATGMIFSPTDPARFVVAVQHPASTDLTAVADGQGDALWLFDLRDVVAPGCDDRHDDGHHGRWYHDDNSRSVRTCDKSDSSNFVKRLEQAAKRGGRGKGRHD